MTGPSHFVPLKEDSFDAVPRSHTSPDYAYVDVVRKRVERDRLDAYVCRECDQVIMCFIYYTVGFFRTAFGLKITLYMAPESQNLTVSFISTCTVKCEQRVRNQ